MDFCIVPSLRLTIAGASSLYILSQPRWWKFLERLQLLKFSFWNSSQPLELWISVKPLILRIWSEVRSMISALNSAICYNTIRWFCPAIYSFFSIVGNIQIYWGRCRVTPLGFWASHFHRTVNISYPEVRIRRSKFGMWLRSSAFILLMNMQIR